MPSIISSEFDTASLLLVTIFASAGTITTKQKALAYALYSKSKCKMQDAIESFTTEDKALLESFNDSMHMSEINKRLYFVLVVELILAITNNLDTAFLDQALETVTSVSETHTLGNLLQPIVNKIAEIKDLKLSAGQVLYMMTVEERAQYIIQLRDFQSDGNSETQNKAIQKKLEEICEIQAQVLKAKGKFRITGTSTKELFENFLKILTTIDQSTKFNISESIAWELSRTLFDALMQKLKLKLEKRRRLANGHYGLLNLLILLQNDFSDIQEYIEKGICSKIRAKQFLELANYLFKLTELNWQVIDALYKSTSPQKPRAKIIFSQALVDTPVTKLAKNIQSIYYTSQCMCGHKHGINVSSIKVWISMIFVVRN